MFEGFHAIRVDVEGVHVHARVGGKGPPVLLLHGYPQTHVMWHAVAPALAESHTVVVADLRGYGDSSKPASESDHSSYAKRAMAADMAGLMTTLGHEQFALVGHDRGARVVHRLCLDHPDRVDRAAVLDIVPTRHVFANVDRALATVYDHWFFLAERSNLPEVLIGGAPEFYLRRKLDDWAGPHAKFAETAMAEYIRCFSDPETIRASCEDYRAAASIDLEHDDADAGRRIACPLLVLWGSHGFVGTAYNVLDVWRAYADELEGHPIDCGHFLAEEAPAHTIAALRAFLAKMA
ncbi:alpha/beta fold hydrolase [Mycobacterium intracellulare]|uniref:alpha/beta fold hydrolase n=1 Tax=Mycobacterium intracellulare TaxID=1767 RepID=UPI00109E384D|nr:alpha/beta hydrolase [Mycobacterium intracellulare]